MMKLTSSAFEHDSPIPSRCSGQGGDCSPDLQWRNLPSGTRSVAIVCRDVNAHLQPHRDLSLVHWLIYNLSPALEGLPEGIPSDEVLTQPVSAAQGTNDFGKTGYRGPIPPVEDREHRYQFMLYALDLAPEFPSGLVFRDFEERIEGHVLGTASLEGTYKRFEDRADFAHIPKDAPSPELGL